MKNILIIFFSAFISFSCYSQSENIPFEEMGITLEEYKAMKLNKKVIKKSSVSILKVNKAVNIPQKPVVKSTNLLLDKRLIYEEECIPWAYPIIIKEEDYNEKDN